MSDPEPLAPRTPDAAARWARGLDRLLAVFVIAFAFLAASFPARNSDVWRHLAVGRVVAEGRYTFGAEPLTFAAENEHWFNPSWLYDLGLYGAYRSVGGPGTVVLKALLVAGLAFCLVRAGGPGWFSPVLAALAVLAASPRFLLQPGVASLGMLALFVWLLTSRRSAVRNLLLVTGCLLWANLDAWSALGPMLVVLWWLGRRVWPGREPETVLHGWVPLACLAVAILNPTGLRNPHDSIGLGLQDQLPQLLVPPDLGVGTWAWTAHAYDKLPDVFTSPWDLPRTLRAADGTANLAGWAYCLLVALGVGSFALNWRRTDPARLLVWVAFAALGAWNLRTAPLFAVIAAPLTARNLAETAAYLSPSLATRRLLTAGRVLPLGAAAGLGALAVFGWLQGFPTEGPRRLAWDVQPNPSWQHAAETIRDWYARGKFDDTFDHGVCLDADAAHHVAWFAPGIRTYLDGRYWVPSGAALPDYLELSRGLSPGGKGEGKGMLQPRGISWVLAGRPWLEGGMRDWVLLSIDGQTGLFGWTSVRRPAGMPPYRAFRLVPDRLAFGTQDDAPLPVPPDAPTERKSVPLWSRLVGGDCGPTWEGSAAAAYLSLFESGSTTARKRSHDAGWSARVAGATATASGTGAVATLLPPVTEAGPPGAALLAIRAARSGLARCPEDARANLELGRAYLILARLTGEPLAALPPLAAMRHAQAAASLEAAARAAPEAEVPHRLLGDLYEERGFLDAALEHRRAEAALARRAGALHGEEPGAFAERVAALDRHVEELDRLVSDRRELLVVRSGAMTEKPFERAQLALSMGLPREALDGILLKSQVLLFGGDGARLQLQLLLDLGRVEDAAQFFASEEVTSSRASLGLVTFPAPGRTGVAGITRLPALAWLSACHAAATGQYSKAVAALRDLAAEMHRESDTVRERLAPAVRLAVASEAATGAVGEGLTWHAQRWEHRNRLTGLLELGESLRPQEAEMLLLAGLLELERGKPDDADTLLRRATETEGAGPAVHELANAYRRRIDAARREPDPEPPPPPPPAGPPVGGRPGGPPGGGRPGGGRPGGPPPA